MILGVPKEIKQDEKRVSVLPHLIKPIKDLGHQVVIQKGAGLDSGFPDILYSNQGAVILDTIEDIYSRSDIIVKVKEPLELEIPLIKESHTIFTFFHFGGNKSLLEDFLKTGATAIAYETVENDNGSLPLLIPMSEIAGRMSVQNGAKFLEGTLGGKGKLVSGVPGVPPAAITIIGGGIVGFNAAKIAAGLGASVNILDLDVSRLRFLDNILPANVTTYHSNSYNIENLLPKTDLLIGAVLVAGKKAPKIISRDLLGLMKKGSVVVDVAVDQGGCLETTKPTTHKDPIYIVDGIVHYCVANMPGSVPMTSTISLTNSTSSYILDLLKQDLKNMKFKNKSLLKGVNVYRGEVTHQGLADSLNISCEKI
ncbi:MAG: alanine dehydrogenase [Pelagibacteraceae bacterium TMED124]|nr:alanine dehydrogenase [Candidatus Neomarinimicrobiota bacterium]RPG17352.1 MAG: alanine dehydrogenase [Pelagibacteraceae bacterium TMED124]|tara:strand:- start:101 stop:1201 length:1101 start_codon:yes stop_codon:yes gene_type:complete